MGMCRVSPAPDDFSVPGSRSDVSLVDVEVGSTRHVVSTGGSDASPDARVRHCLWCKTGAIGRAWARYTGQEAVACRDRDERQAS